MRVRFGGVGETREEEEQEDEVGRVEGGLEADGTWE